MLMEYAFRSAFNENTWHKRAIEGRTFAWAELFDDPLEATRKDKDHRGR
jgi:hypothetical protein